MRNGLKRPNYEKRNENNETVFVCGNGTNENGMSVIEYWDLNTEEWKIYEQNNDLISSGQISGGNKASFDCRIIDKLLKQQSNHIELYYDNKRDGICKISKQIVDLTIFVRNVVTIQI